MDWGWSSIKIPKTHLALSVLSRFLRELALWHSKLHYPHLFLIFTMSFMCLCKYIRDPSHVIELDDVQVKENLTYETFPLRIEDRRTKHLSGK